MNFGGNNAWGLTTFIAFICSTNAIGIDDKLDFGDEGRSHSHTSFVNNGIRHMTSVLPVQRSSSTVQIGNNDNLENIGIVCTDEGCNTTKSTDKSEDTIKTDVIVHIETKVDLTKNKTTKLAGDTPDVPIVVGTDDSNTNNYNGVRTQPKSIFIPDNGPHYFQNTKPRISGSNINTYGSQYPSNSYGSPYPSNSYGSQYPSNTFGSQYRPNSYGSQYPSMKSSFPFVSSRRIDSSSSLYNLNPEVDISIKSMPSLGIDINQDMLNSFNKMDGIELTVPYFDPTLHNHYFGETPPPQYTYYPTGAGIVNPVEFKVMRSSWKPLQWNNQYHTHSVLPIGKDMKCHCEKDNGRNDNWYPNPSINRRSSVYSSIDKAAINDPGSQINDKLAPLN